MPPVTSALPTLVYLHGIGSGDLDDGWKPALNEALQGVGYRSLDEVTVIAPKYPNSLFDGKSDDVYELPPVLEPILKRHHLAAFRRDLERRRARWEAALGPENSRLATQMAGVAAGAAAGATAVGVLKQAHRYLSSKRQARARVLQRVLNQIPPTGDIVLVGHSLGSLVAIDLVRRLPRTVNVKALITLGSPAGHDAFHQGSDRLEMRTPPSNVEVWVNLWGASDPITFRGGVTKHFPWVLDVRVPVVGHKSKRYFVQPVVATAIGRAIYGSNLKTLARVSSGLDLPLNAVETVQLLELSLAHSVLEHLRGEVKDRYHSALALSQSQRIRELAEAYASTNASPPHAMAQLIADNEIFAADPLRPDCPRHLSKSEAALLVIGVAQQNPIAPFEIEVNAEVQRKALEQLTVAMQLGSKLGRHAADSMEFARDQLKSKRSTWKWFAVGTGAAVLVAGTGGLALAATPGLVGAAAITSALASFGPGGMIGGLVTAGVLTGSGAGVIAGGLARSGSVEDVESLVLYQLALCKLRDLEGLPQEEDVWQTLQQLEADIVTELARAEPISDEGAPTVIALQRKRRAVRAAIDCIDVQGWAPSALADLDDLGV